MRVKICGITKVDQGVAIAHLGATALGFICVPSSPRYVTVEQIKAITTALPASVDAIGVFAQATLAEITSVTQSTHITGIQLHGGESPEFCQQLRQTLPKVEIIKALKIKNPADLAEANQYLDCIDTLLLDAYHPQMLGGTGTTLDWKMLQEFCPPSPWLLAGGITPENVLEAIHHVHPQGIDLSSGVEHTPGDKDLDKVARLFQQLGKFRLT
jgi:phosphoribosylanthranilate isomerase